MIAMPSLVACRISAPDLAIPEDETQKPSNQTAVIKEDEHLSILNLRREK